MKIDLKKSYRKFASVILILAMLLNGACTKKNETPAAVVEALEKNTVTLTPEALKAAGIETGHVTKRKMSTTIKVNGILDVPPQNLVTVSAPMGGFIKQTQLLQGMHVNKGDVLAELEHPDYIQLQQDYLESRSQLEFLETEYTRQLELAKENVNAQKTLQQAKSNFEIMKAKVNGLTARLALIHVTPQLLEQKGIQPTIKLYSTITGFVTEVNVNLGKHVTASDVLFKIVDPRHLHAELYVFEKDLPGLKIGQRVNFSLANESRQRLAKIHLIGKEISAERTVRIHCHLDEDYADLIPGMYLKATIETNATDEYTLVNEAILNFEGTNYVFITSDNKTYQLVPVKTGETQDAYTVIIPDDAVTTQTSIVVNGAYELLSLLKNTEE